MQQQPQHCVHRLGARCACACIEHRHSRSAEQST
jgi:hypothetical protein